MSIWPEASRTRSGSPTATEVLGAGVSAVAWFFVAADSNALYAAAVTGDCEVGDASGVEGCVFGDGAV